MTKSIYNAHRRLTSVLYGKAKEITLDTKYEVLHQSSCWSMVKETGLHSKIGMSKDGINAYVSILGQTENGRYRYSIGRRSEYIPFPLKDILDAANMAEGISSDNPDHWGGSDNHGGSPRFGLSTMTPEELFHVVETVLQRIGRCGCLNHQRKDL